MKSKNVKRVYAVLVMFILAGLRCGGGSLNDSDFVEIRKVDPTIRIDMRYATDSNFTHLKLYRAAKGYLRTEAAESLRAVQKDLQEIGLGLKILDAYRPLSVQRKMWEVLPDTNYVADPAVGSRHNRGTAVDVTLVDSLGRELPMPTGFDDFTVMAHREYMKLPKNTIMNRQILERYMEMHGFIGLDTEWWHFDLQDWKKYPIADIPVD